MVAKKRRKEHSLKLQNEKARLKEWRTLEAKRLLAARRKKNEARERAATKERLTGKAKEKVRRMSKKAKKRLNIQTVPDSEQYFKL